MEIPIVYLEYLRQLTSLSAIIAGFSITIAIQIISMKTKHPYATASVFVLCSAAAISIVATSMLSRVLVLISPGLIMDENNSEIAIHKIHSTVTTLSWFTNTGVLLLLTGTALAAGIYSRRMFYWVMVVIFACFILLIPMIIDFRWLRLFVR